MQISKNAVKICLHPNGKELMAKMPDGTPIPCVVEINVSSNKGNLIIATIKLMVHVEDIEQWNDVIQKEVVVHHTLRGEDILRVINRNKGELKV